MISKMMIETFSPIQAVKAFCRYLTIIASSKTLNPSTLSLLSKDIKVPSYDRSKIQVGILHFGVGGFHRAHQALVMDNLFSKGLGHEWGICGVGVLPQAARIRDVMRKQHGLYTLVERGSNGAFSYRVIGSIIDYIYALEDVEAVIERLTQPEARVVSLTITEGAYNINPSTQEFDLENVKEDLNNPSKPKTVFGIVIEALRRRKERGIKGFTIMSCDNLQGNGAIAKKSFTGYAKAIDADLAAWMETNVTFPNSMVDRITPVTTDSDRAKTSEKLGIVDAWPVVCEPFIQWVLEDKFVNGRPPFEQSLVQLTDDVEPYEFMKLRLINAGHQSITYFGLLMNYEFVHDATRNELIVKFLEAYMDREATSTLKSVVEIDVAAYKASIVERFQNPNARDTLARLAIDGSDRILKFMMAVIADRLAKNESIWLSTAIVASFACYLDGVSDNGKTIEIVDSMKDRLVTLSAKLHKDAGAIATEEKIFGGLVKNKVFVDTFKEIYEKIRKDGSEKTLKWLLEK